VDLPFSVCGCKKFVIESLGDHVSTCTSHSGTKKVHDWTVDQIDLFRTTHKVKTKQVVRSRGQRCGDIKLASYLANAAGPVPLVLDLRIAHADKIRTYRADYNNNPPSCVSFMPTIASTSGRIHSEFVCLLFLQAHRETDRFFTTSGVHLVQHDHDQFHYKHTVFSSHLKSKVGNILAKAAGLWITLNIDDVSVSSRSQTHPSHSQTSRLLTSSMSLGPCHPVYTMRVDPSLLAFSLSSHRHSSISLLFSFGFID
jgi:hypothetical protein